MGPLILYYIFMLSFYVKKNVNENLQIVTLERSQISYSQILCGILPTHGMKQNRHFLHAVRNCESVSDYLHMSPLCLNR